MFPASRFTGYDVSEEAVAAARAEARGLGLENVQFAVQDVADMKHGAAFDLVTAFDAIHDQPRPEAVLRNVAAALKPDGVFLMQDIAASSYLQRNLDHPLGTFLYTVSCMHCMSVSLAGGGPGLGAVWGKELALRMLREAGFTEVGVHGLPHDMLNYYYVARKTA
jgi:2-polyprenyl-3-methyl-5-hydroxy-6-metoxy-1,4-benzoquinol methylase